MSANSGAPNSGPPPPAKPDQYAAPVTFTPEMLAMLPHDNQGPKLNAVIWLLTAISAVFLSLRVYCKFLRHNRPWWDDFILIAAWVCILIECAALSAGTGLGYGLHVWDFNFANMGTLLMYMNVAGTFSVTAAIWSKTSFAVTMLRLTEGKMKWFIWYIIISMNVAMGLTALFPWVQCTPVNKAWDIFVPGQCWSPNVLVHYNIFSATYSAVMDITLAMLPWTVIWNLQMKNKEKFGVGIAMSMGVFAGIAGLVKTSKIPIMLSSDFSDGVDLFLWGNAESTITIMAASIPALRVLVRDVAHSSKRYQVSDDKETALKPDGTSRSNLDGSPSPLGSGLRSMPSQDHSERGILS